MAKQKSKPAAENSEGTLNAPRVIVVNLLIAAVLAGAGVWGLKRLKKHVETNVAHPAEVPLVILKTRPAWMCDTLADQIISAVRPSRPSSVLDHDLLERIAGTLQRNPWVRQVRQVRRAYGQSAGDTIEIDCEYRAPVALVAWRNDYILVDGEGVRLPERYSQTQLKRAMLSPDGRTELRVIEGVTEAPPQLPGRPWKGEDLQAGLDLVKLLYGRNATEEIHRVNVSNYNGRRNNREAQMVLVTKYGSEIRWGRPIRSSFPGVAEVSPAEKLRRLAMIKEQYQGRVDAGLSWIDIRFDLLERPADEQPLVQVSTSEQ